MKLELLQRHHIPISKDIHDINFSVGSFTIKYVLKQGFKYLINLIPSTVSCPFYAKVDE